MRQLVLREKLVLSEHFEKELRPVLRLTFLRLTKPDLCYVSIVVTLCNTDALCNKVCHTL